MLGLDKQPHFEPQASHLENLKRDFQRGRLCKNISEVGLHNTFSLIVRPRLNHVQMIRSRRGPDERFIMMLHRFDKTTSTTYSCEVPQHYHRCHGKLFN